MAEHGGAPSGDDAPGFARSIKHVLAVLSAILHTRLDLFVTEIEEERERLRQTLILLLFAFFGLSLGIILLTIFLVVILWEMGWLFAIGGLAALYLATGIGPRSSCARRSSPARAYFQPPWRSWPRIATNCEDPIVSKRLENIARRKQALVEQSARQREELAAIYQRIRSPLDVGGALMGVGRALKTHPLIAAGISSFLVSGYAGKLLRSTGELVKLWRLVLPLWAWWRSRRKAS
jgi:uncharacterized membrane protein YqjE